MWRALIFLSLCRLASAYTMPLGIPNAWIDPDIAAPARPDPWTSEIAGYYYIDWATGTDSGRTYGDPTAPRKTIPNPLPDGSRVELAAGTHGGGVEMELAANGTSGAWVANTSGPVWIIGQEGLTSIVQSMVVRGSYLYIDGCKWDQATGHRFQFSSEGVDWSADHMMLRNCEIDGNAQEAGYGITIAGRSASFKTEFIIIYNCLIHHFGNMASEADPDNNAIATSSWVFDIWCVGNIIHTTTAGIRFGAAGGPDSSDETEKAQRGYFGDNEIYNVLQAGLAIKYSKNIVFSQNYIHDIVDTIWSPSKCIGAQYAPNGLWIIFNLLEGNDNGNGKHGIYLASTDGDPPNVWPVYIIGNVFKKFRHGTGGYSNEGGNGPAAITLRGSQERYVIGNTIYDSCSGIMTDGNTSDSITKFYNNIVFGLTEEGSAATAGKHIIFGDGAEAGNFESNYNLCFESGGSAYYRYNSGNYTGLAAFQAGTSEGDNDVEADPLVTNAATGDFTLQSGSPAKDAGSATLIDTLEALYFSTFAVSIQFDRAGTARPQGAAYDIGAYEYVAAPGSILNATNFNIGTFTVGGP